MDVQGCRLPALKTPQTLPCSSQAPLRPRQTFPAAPTSPWGRGSVLLRRFNAGLPAFKTRQNSPNPPLQLPGATQAAADLSCSSNKSLRAWQCLFMEVQGCLLPAFETPQAPRRHSGRGRPFLQLQQVPEAVAVSFYGGSRLPLASIRNSPTSPNPPLQLPGATQAAADLSCSSNKSLRPWQRLFMDVQGCRLPAFKTPQTLPCSSQAPLRPRQTFPAAPTSPWGRGSVLLRRFKAGLPAFKTRQNSPNPPLQLPGATQAAADLSCSSHKCLRPWQCLFMDVQGCRLPAFKTPQTFPCSSQAPLRPRQTFPAAPTSPRPWQCLFVDVQGCRLPASKTPQTLPCSSQAPLRPRHTFPAAPTSPWSRGSVLLRRFKAPVRQPSKLAKTPQTLPCSSQAPLRPRQTFPAAPTSPWGRGSVLLWRFKAASCQHSKLAYLPKPSPAAPRRHSGRGRPFLQL